MPKKSLLLKISAGILSFVLGLLLGGGAYFVVANPASKASSAPAKIREVGSAKRELKTQKLKETAPKEEAAKAAEQKEKQSAELKSKWVESFNSFAATLSNPVGIAMAPLGADTAITAGNLLDGVAWSTSKVPVAIAALNQDLAPASLMNNITPAITVSDNANAQVVYQSLGNPEQAKIEIEKVLTQGKNPQIKVPTIVLRPGFTIFGQTQWPVAEQAVFAANLKCIPNALPVYELMGQISPAQRWGLGKLPGAHFKGGWGPVAGGYLVRQFGIVELGGQARAVAIITLAPDFNSGIQTLNLLGNWLEENALPMEAVKTC